MRTWNREYVAARHGSTIAALIEHYDALAAVWPSRKSPWRHIHKWRRTSYVHIVLDVPANLRTQVRGIRLWADGSWTPMVFGTRGYVMPDEWKLLI
jgi:hypothetical protein